MSKGALAGEHNRRQCTARHALKANTSSGGCCNKAQRPGQTTCLARFLGAPGACKTLLANFLTCELLPLALFSFCSNILGHEHTRTIAPIPLQRMRLNACSSIISIVILGARTDTNPLCRAGRIAPFAGATFKLFPNPAVDHARFRRGRARLPFAERWACRERAARGCSGNPGCIPGRVRFHRSGAGTVHFPSPIKHALGGAQARPGWGERKENTFRNAALSIAAMRTVVRTWPQPSRLRSTPRHPGRDRASPRHFVGIDGSAAFGSAASRCRHDRSTRSEDQPEIASRRRRFWLAAVAAAAFANAGIERRGNTLADRRGSRRA
jgi:hypothetical protein